MTDIWMNETTGTIWRKCSVCGGWSYALPPTGMHKKCERVRQEEASR